MTNKIGGIHWVHGTPCYRTTESAKKAARKQREKERATERRKARSAKRPLLSYQLDVPPNREEPEKDAGEEPPTETPGARFAGRGRATRARRGPRGTA